MADSIPRNGVEYAMVEGDSSRPFAHHGSWQEAYSVALSDAEGKLN